MKNALIRTVLAGAPGTTALPATAATEIQWWHAFTGRLGELLAEQVEKFNASQSDYVVVGTHKGNYSETLNAGIAAFRAGEQPHLLMVFEVGTATMMGAKGAIKPVFEVMKEGGAPFNPDGYLPPVKGYYTTPFHIIHLPQFSTSIETRWPKPISILIRIYRRGKWSTPPWTSLKRPDKNVY